jgi:hypothetical protein
MPAGVVTAVNSPPFRKVYGFEVNTMLLAFAVETPSSNREAAKTVPTRSAMCLSKLRDATTITSFIPIPSHFILHAAVPYDDQIADAIYTV